MSGIDALDGGRLDELDMDAIFRRRAARLAERPGTNTVSASVPALICRLGTERCAVELSSLAEVLQYTGCTAVPGTPRAVLGVGNVRGDIRLLVNLGGLMEVSRDGEPRGGYLLMVRQGAARVGLRVDAIDDVRGIEPDRRADMHVCTSRFVKAITSDSLLVVDVQAALASLGIEPE